MSVERSYFAAIASAPERARSVRVSDDEIADPQIKVAHKAFWGLVDDGTPPDFVTLSEWLRRNAMSEFLPESDLIEMLNYPGSIDNAAVYRDALLDRSRERKMHALATAIHEDEATDPLDISRQFAELSALGNSEHVTITEAMTAMIADIEQREKVSDGVVGVKTGFATLDKDIGGWQEGDVNMIGGRSGSGKTAFMINSVRCSDHPVGIISAEQPANQIAMRVAAQHANINLRKMRIGEMTEQEYARMASCIQEFHEKPIFIYDKGAPTIEEVEAQIYKWVFAEGVKTVWVDFMQLITGGKQDSGWERLGDYAYRLKGIAKDLSITINCLSQVKQEVDKRQMGDNGMGRMPGASDLAESNKLEQAADGIIMLYRPGYYEPRVPEYEAILYINIAKNRHGPLGHRKLIWVGQFTKVMDWCPDKYQTVIDWSRKKT